MWGGWDFSLPLRPIRDSNRGAPHPSPRGPVSMTTLPSSWALGRERTRIVIALQALEAASHCPYLALAMTLKC